MRSMWSQIWSSAVRDLPSKYTPMVQVSFPGGSLPVAPSWRIGLAAQSKAQGHDGNDTGGERAPRKSRSHNGRGPALTRGGGVQILSVQISKRDDGVRVREHRSLLLFRRCPW